ncbi:MAG: ferredoxin [Candidatus Proteinoplasmatales archaeon SG8-5]|nr:MAG: ferredoxin [Candidatus Proteinoplasmatales archaeon SG8-5]
MRVDVNPNKCLRCGLCVGSCPENAIFLREVELVFNDDCIGCKTCIRLCPVGALSEGG